MQEGFEAKIGDRGPATGEEVRGGAAVSRNEEMEEGGKG